MTLKSKHPAKDAQIDNEIEFHLEALTAANIARGLPPSEARRRAVLEFGGAEQVKQQVREVHLSAALESVRANFRAALRFLRRSPGFAVTIILTLTLGIGVNSAVFSAIDAIVLRPLAFPHGDELVRIHQLDTTAKAPENFVAPARVEDWNRMSTSFQAVSGYYTGDATLLAGPYPQKITVAFVAPRFLQMWGIAPARGRDFSANEQKFGGPSAVLVTDGFWHAALHADPAAVGKPIHLGGDAFTVVGVLPAGFRFPEREVDVFEPSPADAPYAQGRDSTWFTVIARLKPGVTLARAQAEMTTVQAQLGRQFGKPDSILRPSLEPLKSVIVGTTGKSLWLLYGSVCLLLLIACTNIAALLMARTAEREQEIAIRYALGASRSAIIGQLLSEVFVLALAGSLAGLFVAALAAHAFTLFSLNLPRVDEVAMNWRIVLYSLVTAMATTLFCGLVPAVRGTRRNLSGSMAHSGRTHVSGRSAWQWTLVGIQVALAVTLLVASGLLLRSFQSLGRIDSGFDPSQVLTLRISAGWGETADMGKLNSRINRSLQAIRALPGVEAAATANAVPGNSEGYPAEFNVTEGAAGGSGDGARRLLANSRIVSAGYFEALRIPLLQGEACRDGWPSSAMVVNRSFAESYFPSGSGIGYHLQEAGGSGPPIVGEVRGIVADAREEGRETPAQPTVYWCFAAPMPDPYYLIRTHGEPMAMADTLRQTLRTLEPARSLFSVMALEDRLDQRQAENRLRTVLVTAFALTAIALVSLGLYGTISYLGRTRRREVGLRLALGAVPSQIVRMFVLQGLRVTMAGGCIGLLLGAALTRLLAGLLFGVSPLDPLTYAGVAALTLLVALAASLVPSLRAVQVDPTEMLREE